MEGDVHGPPSRAEPEATEERVERRVVRIEDEAEAGLAVDRLAADLHGDSACMAAEDRGRLEQRHVVIVL
jgi:hypothetical protein